MRALFANIDRLSPFRRPGAPAFVPEDAEGKVCALQEAFLAVFQVFRQRGLDGRWLCIDRGCTREQFLVGTTYPEEAGAAFDYGCLLVDWGFSGELTQERFECPWQTPGLRGCYGMAERLLHGLLSGVGVIVADPGQPARRCRS